MNDNLKPHLDLDPSVIPLALRVHSSLFYRCPEVIIYHLLNTFLCKALG